MTPVQMAKKKVGEIFETLLSGSSRDTTWKELVLGGFECRASITGGVLTGYVGEGGEYAVYAGKMECERMITLQSGSFGAWQSVASVANGRSDSDEVNPRA